MGGFIRCWFCIQIALELNHAYLNSSKIFLGILPTDPLLQQEKDGLGKKVEIEELNDQEDEKNMSC